MYVSLSYERINDDDDDDDDDDRLLNLSQKDFIQPEAEKDFGFRFCVLFRYKSIK